MDAPTNDELSRQARDGVRRVPWRSVALSAAGASAIGLLGAAGLAPLLASVGVGTLSQGAFAQWLMAFGGSVVANWTGELAVWATGRGLTSEDAAARPEMQQELAGKLDELLARDAQAAADLARLLRHIDALPQSIAALQDEVGAQSDLLLAQYELLAQLGVDLQRLGIVTGALQPALAEQTSQVLAALETCADRTDAKIAQMIAELQSMLTALTPQIEVRAEGERATAINAGPNSTNTVDNSQRFTFEAGSFLNQGTVVVRSQNEVAGAGVFQVPYPPNPHFRGRDAELTRLAELLLGTASETAAVLPAVSGLGGIGKTQLASEFAHRHRDNFPGGIFWLNMAQPETIASQVAAASGPGGLDLPGWSGFDIDAKIAAARRAWNEPIRRLLVFDNLEDPRLLQEWRPTSGGTRVLMTTRRGLWFSSSGVRSVPLKTLARPESIMLLLAPRYGEQLEEVVADVEIAAEADAICGLVGDLPLALALAGTYLEQTPSLSLMGYRTRLSKALLAHPSLEAKLEESLPTGHIPSIAATIALSYQMLDPVREQDRQALLLLFRASQFASAPIPQRLLVRILGHNPEEEYQAAQINILVRRLTAVGLIELLPQDEVSIHSLIASFISAVIGDTSEALDATIDALNQEVYWIIENGRPVFGHALIPHLYSVADRTRERGTTSNAMFYTNISSLLYHLGDHEQAFLYAERALSIYKQEESNVNYAHVLNNTGNLYLEFGRYDDARSCFEDAMSIWTHELGLDNPFTGLAVNNIGIVLYRTGDLDGAINYYEQALAIWEDTLGFDHPDTAQAINNIGVVLHTKGRFQEAREYYEQALPLFQDALGDNHPDTALLLANLGELQLNLGNFSTARSYFKAALAAYEQSLGAEHPTTQSVRQAINRLNYKESEL